MAFFINDHAWAKEQEISTEERQLIARVLCQHRDKIKGKSTESVRIRFMEMRLIQIFTRNDVPKITKTEVNEAMEKEKAFMASEVGEKVKE